MIGTLANFLFELAARAAGKGPRGQTLRLRVRREDLARPLELTPAALEREFERLVARRAIAMCAGETVTPRGREAPRGPREAPLPAPSTPEEALRAILADERFRAAPRTSMLLAYLVEKALAGETECLDGERVVVEALRLPPRAAARLETSVPALVEHLRWMLERYYDDGDEHEFVIRVVPGGCRVVIQSHPLRSRPLGAAADGHADDGRTDDRRTDDGRTDDGWAPRGAGDDAGAGERADDVPAPRGPGDGADA